MTYPEPLAECPDHLDELPRFDPNHWCACGDCGYVMPDYEAGERYHGPDGQEYPIVKDRGGGLTFHGWVENWTEIHYCFVCDTEVETSNGT